MDGTHADGIVLSAATELYKRPLHVYHSPDEPPIISSGATLCQSANEPICLAHVPVCFGYSANSCSLAVGDRDHFISLAKRYARYNFYQSL